MREIAYSFEKLKCLLLFIIGNGNNEKKKEHEEQLVNPMEHSRPPASWRVEEKQTAWPRHFCGWRLFCRFLFQQDSYFGKRLPEFIPCEANDVVCFCSAGLLQLRAVL